MPDNSSLVAYCGLVCGNCGAYRRKRCKGCKMGGGFHACPVRRCCQEKSLAVCAGCHEHSRYEDCKRLNNFISKIFSLIFRTNRPGNLREIDQVGLENFANQRIQSGMK